MTAPARPAAAPRPRHRREDWRLVLVILAFALAYGAVGVRMGLMALAEPEEPALARGEGDAQPVRRAIVDREGRVMAANLPAWSLFARPREVDDPEGTARALAPIFPGLEVARTAERLASRRSFVWVRRPVTPRQRQRVMDLDPARPALRFGRREMRVYPAGRAAAHVLGGVGTEAEGVRSATLVGRSGTEHHFDAALRDPGRAGAPLALSLDLAVQGALRDVLARGMDRMGARAAAGVMLDVGTGEVIALVSLPDFDPNAPVGEGAEGEANPRFNRAVAGRYELGSVFKTLTAAIALDAGVAAPQTEFDTRTPLTVRRQRFVEHYNLPSELSVTDIVVRSSNLGSARLALETGTDRFRAYLERFGLFDPLDLELAEAGDSRPLLPPEWTDLSTVTISFGHGLSVSPMHLAAAYATLANGGRRVVPTLVRGGRAPGERVVSARTSAAAMRMLRETVSRGTATRADVPGYRVGGKTGTADKPDRAAGGYHPDKVISTFASVFPTTDPKYAMVIMLDEPTDPESGSRQASRTAVPVTGAAIRRIAPILGLRPLPGTVGAAAPALAVSLASE